jgi:hypothetical protein
MHISILFSILQEMIVSLFGGFQFSWQACLTVCCLVYSSTMMMVVIHCTEMLGSLWTTECYSPGDHILHKFIDGTFCTFLTELTHPTNLWTNWQIFMESGTTFAPLGTNFKFILLNYPLLIVSWWWMFILVR